MDTNNEIILYQPDTSISLEVKLEDETVWLTQAQMVDLFHNDSVKFEVVQPCLSR